MTNHDGMQHPPTFKLSLVITLVIFFILGISFYGQQASPVKIPPTGTMTASPTPSRTPAPTATFTPSPTQPPPTSTLANINLNKLFTLGRGIVSSITHSPDGRLIAMIDTSSLKWFDAETYEHLGEVWVSEYARGPIVFSPDNRLIAVRDFGCELINLQEQGVPEGICGGHWPCGGCTFSPDGGFIAYTSYDRTTGGPYYSIGIWDIAGQQRAYDPLPTLLDFRYHIMSNPAISADSRLVAAGHSDSRVYVWNIEDGETRFILEGHAGNVESVDFSNDGRYLASGSADGTVRLWNPATGQLVRVITGFLDNVTGVEFTEDSRQLRIQVREQADQVYDLNSGQLTPGKRGNKCPIRLPLPCTHKALSRMA